MITKKNIDIAKRIYSQLEKWNFANRVLTDFFETNKLNKSDYIILIKILLIDGLYRTNLKDQIAIAKHISKISLLDNFLEKGEISIVDEIAKWNNKNLISFASKFCHFHNKKAYPIYDNYVCISLRELMGWKNNKIYADFRGCVDKFKSKNRIVEIEFEDIDKYLWLFGLRERLRKGKTDINKEVYEFYINNRNIFEQL